MFVEDHSPADLELHKFHVSLRTGLTEKATTPIQPEPAIDEAGDDGWAEARWDETHHFYIRRDGRDRFLEMSVVDDCAGRETVLGTTQLDIARLRLARGPCVAVASVFNEQQQHVADLQVNQKALQLYGAPHHSPFEQIKDGNLPAVLYFEKIFSFLSLHPLQRAIAFIQCPQTQLH